MAEANVPRGTILHPEQAADLEQVRILREGINRIRAERGLLPIVYPPLTPGTYATAVDPEKKTITLRTV